jgi:hypothetical protein
MNPEISLLLLQEAATAPCRLSDGSSLYPRIYEYIYTYMHVYFYFID